MMADRRLLGFDPEDYGFKLYAPSNGRGAIREGCDYLVYTKKREGSFRGMRISMCSATGEMVEGLLGETVDVYFSEEGTLMLAEGNRATLTKNTVNGKRPSTMRSMVSVTGLTDLLFDKFGAFKRLYLKAKVINIRGSFAVVFAPTGERDVIDDEE